MLIEGKLNTYNVQYKVHGITYAKIILKVQVKKWGLFNQWKEIHESSKTFELETLERMYPHDMLELFVKVIKEYEDYTCSWQDFRDIQSKGSKLKVV